ncbi:ABC transporter permease [Actinomyces qiguomingii]|uniref:ABC transporter permease n=1 Tax=Actinomyces qiguomingii TaxID=2057800 RepID=UPI000CA025B4|nr:ABC transporter permease [Actinomyces qiguomingii]
MILEQLKIELKIYLRQPLYLLFSILMPVVSFAMFGSIYKNSSYGGIDFFSAYIPGFCVIILFASSVYNVGNQVVADREKGIYRRLGVTPVSLPRIMMVVIMKVFLVAMTAFLLIMLTARFIFEVAAPNMALFVAVFLVAVVYSLLFGFGIGAITQKINTFSAVMMALFMPMIILSDATVPLSVMPRTLQNIAEVNPLYRLNLVLRVAWNPENLSAYHDGFYISVVTLPVFMVLFLLLVASQWNRARN